jgi:CheY-like chemotaxis protein
MPRLDGFELIRRLRADRPQLPVVVMSGNAPADLNDSLRPHGSGPLVFVHKPMRLGQLLAALRQCGGAPLNGTTAR